MGEPGHRDDFDSDPIAGRADAYKADREAAEHEAAIDDRYPDLVEVKATLEDSYNDIDRDLVDKFQEELPVDDRQAMKKIAEGIESNDASVRFAAMEATESVVEAYPKQVIESLKKLTKDEHLAILSELVSTAGSILNDRYSDLSEQQQKALESIKEEADERLDHLVSQ